MDVASGKSDFNGRQECPERRHDLQRGRPNLRPSQDCSRTYGYGFSLYEVVTLSTTEYEERAVVKVGPDWHPGLYGTHTYNRSNRVETTDGKFKVTRRLRG